MERKRVMFRYPPSGDGTRYEADALNLGPYCTREVRTIQLPMKGNTCFCFISVVSEK